MSFNPLMTAALGIFLAGCGDDLAVMQTGAAASAACPIPSALAANTAQLLSMVNSERSAAGLRPVALSGTATQVAQAYACETAARRDISHIGSDGSNAGTRLMRTGIQLREVAENTANGYTSPGKTMAAWMASPGHRENILTPDVTLAGVGQTDGAYPTWVLILYVPR